jgi:hypothetical protein
MVTRSKAHQIALIDISINAINNNFHSELRPYLIRIASKIHHSFELTSEERSLWCGIPPADRNLILTGDPWEHLEFGEWLDITDSDDSYLRQPNQPQQLQPQQPIAPNQQFEIPLQDQAAEPALNLPGPEPGPEPGPAPKKSKSFTKQIKAQAQKLSSKITHSYQTRGNTPSSQLAYPGGLKK